MTEKKLYGFQCNKCFLKSGIVSKDMDDAPTCCGGDKMMPYEIHPIKKEIK